MSQPASHPPGSPWHAALAACRPEDFDGHTDFARLTPGERLDWLDEAAGFLLELRGAAPLSGPTQEHEGKNT